MPSSGDRAAERHERAAAIAHGVAHQLGDLAAERFLPPLHALPRNDVILEHQVVRHRDRHELQPAHAGVEAGAEQAGLGGLQFAAVAAPAFRIEEQVVLVQQLADVGLERDQVRRVFHVAADRQRAGDVLVDQPQRPAEQVDAGGDDRRPDARRRPAPAARRDSRCGCGGSTRRRCGPARPRRRRTSGVRRSDRSCGGWDRADTRARDTARSAASSSALPGSPSRASARRRSSGHACLRGSAPRLHAPARHRRWRGQWPRLTTPMIACGKSHRQTKLSWRCRRGPA